MGKWLEDLIDTYAAIDTRPKTIVKLKKLLKRAIVSESDSLVKEMLAEITEYNRKKLKKKK